MESQNSFSLEFAAVKENPDSSNNGKAINTDRDRDNFVDVLQKANKRDPLSCLVLKYSYSATSDCIDGGRAKSAPSESPVIIVIIKKRPISPLERRGTNRKAKHASNSNV